MFRKAIPDPRGFSAANLLDVRIYQLRNKTFRSVCEEAQSLRQNSVDATEAMSAIQEFMKRLQSVSYEVISYSYTIVALHFVSEKNGKT